MTTKSAITVSVQLICIAVLVVTGPVLPGGTGPLVMACAGLLVVLSAVAVIGFYNLRIEPDVAQHARLVTTGVYHWIRHPMYTGGTLIAIAWVWDAFSVWRLLAAIVLIGNFIVKLTYEEKLLAARFPEYSDYKRRTKRLVPGVY